MFSGKSSAVPSHTKRDAVAARHHAIEAVTDEELPVAEVAEELGPVSPESQLVTLAHEVGHDSPTAARTRPPSSGRSRRVNVLNVRRASLNRQGLAPHQLARHDDLS